MSNNVHQLFITTSLLLFFFSATAQTVNCRLIKNENGISYAGNSKTPFTGHCVQYYKTGNREYEGNYKSGIANGEHKWYYKNGRLRETITYVISEKDSTPVADGTGKEWFENGKIRTVINYRAGQYDGPWTEYDIQGHIVKQGLYKDNQLISGSKITARIK
jgi:antitoxin component YwqK of YwqJK toxin-antitoxin module